ncbi:hypothetical protein TTHERM_00624410 (macronuclear) [Tetrahymena thermophila SB210]|uniref:Uncharacterized protein n=1 Tax=Tetrahymena thermophila (strain SB210) TaxID=312017 RepID=Q240U2_TETTS|nr:hypothetical protein TTHERM_00624410 [Tetrahymena thermophila SB210]EAS02322.1 hypothetical protein TTHERM_00624410 [Tetrahymena thermophila SB210]|eukprot:XP_001022567.1 hypothetical protein TTHERM_00624410 [Tetrahymena thermophila SB210]
MSVKPPKVQMNVSKQELYYISRNLFRRNKSLLDDNSDKDYVFTSPKNKRKSAILPNRPFTSQSCSPIKPKYMRDMEQKNQENFEKFFNTSANKINQQCEDEFAKSRERFLYSRERSTTANTSFNLSQYIQSSPFRRQQSGLQESFSPKGNILNKSILKLSNDQIVIPDDYHNLQSNLKQSNSVINSTNFNNSYNPQYYKRFSTGRNSFVDDKNNQNAQTVDQQLQEEQQKMMMQQVFAQIEQQNADEQWKNVKYRAPRYTFYKNSPRKTIIGPQSNSLLDNEKRFNNFYLEKPDINHTIDMKSLSGRDYKVFKQFKLHDLVYPASNKQYEKVIYDNKTLKCQFDLQKQDSNDGVIGREFYQKQHKDDIPATDLNCDMVIKAHNDLLPFKKNRIPQFDKISARERQSSSPYRILTQIENPYLHEKRQFSQKRIKIQKCKD